jgi:hypothetical protein
MDAYVHEALERNARDLRPSSPRTPDTCTTQSPSGRRRGRRLIACR